MTPKTLVMESGHRIWVDARALDRDGLARLISRLRLWADLIDEEVAAASPPPEPGDAT